MVASGDSRTGMPFKDKCLLNLREGILGKWSDNRLLLLGERLGVRAKVTFH